MLFFVLLFTASTLLTNVNGFSVSGTINFHGTNESPFPSNTWLKVSVEDTSLMDAPANVLKSVDLDVSGKTFPLKYRVDDIDDVDYNADVSISARINVRWKPDGDEWIKKGDFLTDTIISLDDLTNSVESSHTYQKDFDVVKYQ